MKALVLFSGGLDSTTCLAMAVDKYGAENTIALSVYYGQKHKRELEAAESVCQFYGVKRHSINLEEVFKSADCSLLFGDVPEGSYADQMKKGIPSTYVPFRNGVMLSVAVAYAYSAGCSKVIYGAHQDDAASVYPDCTPSFLSAMNAAANTGTGGKIIVEAPFIYKTKKDIVRKGLELNVPYEKTWSCYNGGEKACGKCGTCIDRLKAFEENGVRDPLEYER